MGAAASQAQKMGKKYQESSRQNGPRKNYNPGAVEGCGPGTFESTQVSKVVREELDAEAGAKVANTRQSTYRSKEATSDRQSSRAPSVHGDAEPSDRQRSKVSRPSSVVGEDLDADRGASKRTSTLQPPQAAESRNVSKRSPRQEQSLLEQQRAESKRTTADRNASKSTSLPPIDKKKEKNENKLEIVEAQGTGFLDDIEASAQVAARTDKRSKTVGLHQAHSAARESVLAARGGGVATGGDPMGGLSVGMKVIGQGKVGQEMGIGTVLKAGNTPGMVIIRMEASGKEMALPVSKLQKLNDDKMVKAAEKLVKRIPNRDPTRRSTFA